MLKTQLSAHKLLRIAEQKKLILQPSSCTFHKVVNRAKKENCLPSTPNKMFNFLVATFFNREIKLNVIHTSKEIILS